MLPDTPAENCSSILRTSLESILGGFLSQAHRGEGPGKAPVVVGGMLWIGQDGSATLFWVCSTPIASMLFPGVGLTLGRELGWIERLHTDAGAPAPEKSSTCTVSFGMGEDSYVM